MESWFCQREKAGIIAELVGAIGLGLTTARKLAFRLPLGMGGYNGGCAFG